MLIGGTEEETRVGEAVQQLGRRVTLKLDYPRDQVGVPADHEPRVCEPRQRQWLLLPSQDGGFSPLRDQKELVRSGERRESEHAHD